MRINLLRAIARMRMNLLRVIARMRMNLLRVIQAVAQCVFSLSLRGCEAAEAIFSRARFLILLKRLLRRHTVRLHPPRNDGFFLLQHNLNDRILQRPQAITLLAALLIACCLAGAAYADVFSSDDLIKDAKEWDGEKVVYAGEAVTAIMGRGGYSWVNLSDGNNAIGIWAKSSLLKQVKFTGNYKTSGDIVEVIGRFHRACKMHQGDLDIHAYSVRVIKRGHSVPEKVDDRRNRVSVTLFVLLAITVIIFRKRT